MSGYCLLPMINWFEIFYFGTGLNRKNGRFPQQKRRRFTVLILFSSSAGKRVAGGKKSIFLTARAAKRRGGERCDLSVQKGALRRGNPASIYLCRAARRFSCSSPRLNCGMRADAVVSSPLRSPRIRK